MVGVEGNDLTQKIVFCYLGSMLVYNFFWLRGTNQKCIETKACGCLDMYGRKPRRSRRKRCWHLPAKVGDCWGEAMFTVVYHASSLSSFQQVPTIVPEAMRVICIQAVSSCIYIDSQAMQQCMQRPAPLGCPLCQVWGVSLRTPNCWPPSVPLWGQ